MNRYIYVITGTIVLLFAGMVYAWSILSAPLAIEFTQWSNAQISLTFTICMISFCISGLIRGMLAEKLSPKFFILLSAILYLLGLYISSKTQNNILTLYLGFGLICGLASGFTYNTVVSVVCEWFQDKQGLVSGVLLMGYGFGSFFIGKIYQILALGPLGWRKVFIGFGIAIFILFLFFSLVLRRPTKEEYNLSLKKINNTISCDFTSFEMIRTKSFWIYLLWVIFLASAGLSIIGHANGMLLETIPSIKANTAATIVGIVAIFNGLGRVFWGSFYDKVGYKMAMFYINVVFAISVITLLTALKTGNMLFIILGFSAGGLFYAGAASLNSTFINDFYGNKYYAVNFSVIQLNVLISSFGSTIAGYIYDYTQTYIYVILLLAIEMFLSLICVLVLQRPDKQI